jgi:hypothetical protein
VASLEYALLAEFARVDPVGLLTVVGGGFVRAQPPALPAQLQVYVTFQVSFQEEEEPPSFQVVARPPRGQYEFRMDGQVPRLPGVPAIDGEISVPVAVGMMLPVPDAGKYQVDVTLSDGGSRELRFLVVESKLPSA